MKRLLLATSLLMLVVTGLAHAGNKFESVIVAQIHMVGPEQLQELQRLEIDVDRCSTNPPGVVTVYLSEEEFGLLQKRGYALREIPNYAKLYADSLWEATKDSPDPLKGYHTYDELVSEMHQIASDHPDLCHLESAGQSVQGRELLFMKISDNVDMEEPEPEFKYISSMHGDEPVGMELCLFLINLLVQEYGLNDTITALVDETEIWIMPLMNPDGYVQHSRYNANGHDLNRKFPDRIRDPDNRIIGRPHEVRAVMNWAFTKSTVLSANLHTGALVVNYPYDSNESGRNVYTPSPDDELFIYQSETYSWYNQPMWNGSFPHGITNGADWYVIYGGMQDWNYVWLGDNEVTIELSNNKWPNYSRLPELWGDNRISMMAYMNLCQEGVRGIVTDATNGFPLAATVEVVDVDHEVYTDPDVGDYHRMLLPGTYSLRFSASGYQTQVMDNVVVNSGPATELNVAIQPLTEVSLELIPDDIYVSTGEKLRYAAKVYSNVDTSLSLSYWSYVTLPNGSEYGPVFGPFNFPLNPYQSRSGRVSKTIPGNAPLGTCKYSGYVGVYPGQVIAEDSFNFRIFESSVAFAQYGRSFGATDQDLERGSVLSDIPQQFELNQNYPNPFNATTTISYSLPTSCHVKLEVFNARGQRIGTIVDEFQEAGYRVVGWDGSRVSSGVYFCKLSADGFSQTRKMMLVK
jgi:hypothetical protein